MLIKLSQVRCSFREFQVHLAERYCSLWEIFEKYYKRSNPVAISFNKTLTTMTMICVRTETNIACHEQFGKCRTDFLNDSNNWRLFCVCVCTPFILLSKCTFRLNACEPTYVQPLTDTLHEVIITDSKGKYCFHRCLSTGEGLPNEIARM